MSLKKIAQITGVSPSTVSRVLNNKNHKCASEEIKDKIWSAARELGYLPNESARNLKKGASSASAPLKVSVLLSRFDSLETDPFFKEVFRHIETELFEQHCILNHVLYARDLMDSSFCDSGSTSGLMILGRCPQSLLPKLKSHYRNIVGIGRNPTEYEIDEIVCDGVMAARTAMEYLISLGHRKIAYIGDCSSETRFTGYHESLISHKIPFHFQNVHPTAQTEPEGYLVMRSIMEGTDKPTAIFCANDVTALGVLRAYHEFPQTEYQPSVISIDNIEAAQDTTPLLTSINIPKEDMGRLAVTLLISRIRGKHTENVRLEVPCRLVVRESCYLLR